MTDHTNENLQTTSVSSLHRNIIKAEEHDLSINACHLARYIMENEAFIKKDEMQKSTTPFNFGAFFCLCEKYPYLKDNDPEKIKFINLYRDLELKSGKVTARTLVATQVHGKSFID